MPEMPNTNHALPLRWPRKWKLAILAAVCMAGVLLLLMLVMLPGGWPDQALVARLRSLPPNQYFDEHWNADKRIRAVLKRRYSGTEAVCKEIDRATGNGSREYLGMLYYCLGYVKDPASIPWLERRLREGDSSLICEWWVRPWWAYPSGAHRLQLKWLNEPDRWAAFFRQQARREQDTERRLALLKPLAGWFHDHETIQFFVELEKAPGTEGETLVLTQLYLRQHKQPFDAARLPAAIERVRLQQGGVERLLWYAEELRHEAFMPLLISLAPAIPVREHIFDLPSHAQRALSNVTFRLDIVDQAGWQAWYANHRDENHEVWLRQAAVEFEAMADKDPKEARKFFEKAQYRWNDLALLPWIKRWTKFRYLGDYLMGWICSCFHPVWRDDLR